MLTNVKQNNLRLLTLGLLLTFAAAPALHGQKAGEQGGVLRITADGQSLGTERYRIRRSGANLEAVADIQLDVRGTRIEQNTSMTLSPAGEPLSYEWRMDKPKKMHVSVLFDGGKAVATYPLESGQEDRQEFHFNTGRVAVLDNNVFHHFALFARLYDSQKQGVQSFPVFIPQSIQPGTATIESKGTDTLQVNGENVLARRLEIITTDNRVLVWIKEDGGLLRLEVPAAKVVVEPVP
jgi:hypothetical protein